MTALRLTPIDGAEPFFDADGREIVNVATCGTCGRSWNDAQISDVTPAPAGRCPFEDSPEHERDPDADRKDAARALEAHGFSRDHTGGNVYVWRREALGVLVSVTHAEDTCCEPESLDEPCSVTVETDTGFVAFVGPSLRTFLDSLEIQEI